jgi:integrase
MRRIRSPKLEHRSNRLRLPIRGKPYYQKLAEGLHLGYRRNAGPGSWSIRKSDGRGGNWIKVIGPADDYDGVAGAVDYWTAQAKAREMVHGAASDTGKLATVAEAIADYRDDLERRGGRPGNASILEFHVPPMLASKLVAALSARELKAFQRELLAKDLKPSSVTRIGKSLAAVLSLAASHDPRIRNRDAWRIGLASLPDDNEAARSHVILSENQVRAMVPSAYQESEAFGLFVELGALTGARPVQLRRLTIGDVQRDRVLMPSSLKGKGKKVVKRRPIPIPAALAARLKAMSKDRPDSAPLLLKNGEPFTETDQRLPFRRTVERIGLDPDTVTYYALRHTWITRQLIRGTPIRLVADAADTSVAMIEKTYSRYITHHGDDLLRAGMVDLSMPPEGPKVVPLR